MNFDAYIITLAVILALPATIIVAWHGGYIITKTFTRYLLRDDD